MKKTKPEEVEIISITGGTYVNSDGETCSKVFGLGDDNLLYEWDYGNKKWFLY